MNCIICQRPISTERMELQPRSVCCSRACTIEHKRRLRVAGAARQRASKAGPDSDGGVMP